MFSFRTQEVLKNIFNDEVSKFDGSINPLNEKQKNTLHSIIQNYDQLEELSDSNRAEFLFNLEIPTEKVKEAMNEEEPYRFEYGTSNLLNSLRINRIRACSFRGIAPTGELWEHDFYSRSHLLFGPNGCGKSSLLGAISWCFSDRIFRDDCPPKPPEEFLTYISNGKVKRGPLWKDAATLTSSDCQPNTIPEYWVEVELKGKSIEGKDQSIWIRRHSNDGFGYSYNGEEPWERIRFLRDIGISDLDIELCILMPARAAHLRFGKDQELIHTFSQIVGLNELEKIAEIANGACTQLRSKATKTENDIKKEESAFSQIIKEIRINATEEIKKLEEYKTATTDMPDLEKIELLSKSVNSYKEEIICELANEIGLELPKDLSTLDDTKKGQLDDLPGRVTNACDELSKPVKENFKKTFMFANENENSINDISKKLEAFKEDASAKIGERIKWAKKEKQEKKLSLYLEAAKFYDEDPKHCPVCEHEIDGKPIAEKLQKYVQFSNLDYLKRSFSELDIDLQNELEKIIPEQKYRESEASLANRLINDWNDFKKTFLPGLLSNLSDKKEIEIKNLENELMSCEEDLKEPLLSTDLPEEYRKEFSNLEDVYIQSLKYIELVNLSIDHADSIKERLNNILILLKTENGSTSLNALLQKGRDLALNVKPIQDIQSQLKKASELKEKIDKDKKQIEKQLDLYGCLLPLRSLSKVVNKEVTNIVKQTGEKMEEHYNKLYKDEHFQYGNFTTGHAANPDVRNELNLYLKRGNTLLPFNVIANASRRRALILSLIFALQERRENSLGFLILDDPITSLDDEHRFRFLDHFIDPLLDREQIILATHNEDFFKNAEQALSNCEKFYLAPRRNENDKIVFEPGNFLERVGRSLREHDCSWRDSGMNLRKWVKRVVVTINSYCPENFIIENNLFDSIEAYKSTNYPQLKNSKREEIVKALHSNHVWRVLNKIHHEENNVFEPEVRDAYEVLYKCQRDVKDEIENLRKLWKHRMTGRPLPFSPTTFDFSDENIYRDTQIMIVGTAAAAREGQPIELIEEPGAILREYSFIIVNKSTLSPIARAGQLILVAGGDDIPQNGDLVAAKDKDNKTYLRRFWQFDEEVILEGANPTDSCKPIRIHSNSCFALRIIGVLFKNYPVGNKEQEWSALCGHQDNIFVNLYGIKVHGDSMEPIARQGQVILARNVPTNDWSNIQNASLVCVELFEGGAVLKRCYQNQQNWQLISVNPNSPEDPILTSFEKIRRVFILEGVLFETDILLELN